MYLNVLQFAQVGDCAPPFRPSFFPLCPYFALLTRVNCSRHLTQSLLHAITSASRVRISLPQQHCNSHSGTTSCSLLIYPTSMASIAAMPPTPQQQQSFSHMPPAGSPQSGHPNGMSGYGHPYNMSFDGQHGHPMQQQQQQQQQPIYSQSFPNGPVSNPGYARSFGEGFGGPRGYGEKPQIYTVRIVIYLEVLTSD